MDGLVLLGAFFVFLGAVWVLFIAPVQSQQQQMLWKLRAEQAADSREDELSEAEEADQKREDGNPAP